VIYDENNYPQLPPEQLPQKGGGGRSDIVRKPLTFRGLLGGRLLEPDPELGDPYPRILRILAGSDEGFIKVRKLKCNKKKTTSTADQNLSNSEWCFSTIFPSDDT